MPSRSSALPHRLRHGRARAKDPAELYPAQRRRHAPGQPADQRQRVSGDEVATLDYLEVGHSKTFTQSLTVTKTVESKPQVSYTVSGGSARVYQLSLEPLTLTPSNPKLALTLKSDLNSILSSDRATLTLNISNEGNIPFTSVTISDESLGKIGRGHLHGGGQGQYLYQDRQPPPRPPATASPPWPRTPPARATALAPTR